MKTKNYLVPALLLFGVMSFGLFGTFVLPTEAVVKATTVKKAATKSSVVWAASGKAELAKIKNSFVRSAYKTKVEKYAIRKKIKTITSAVVKGMHE